MAQAGYTPIQLYYSSTTTNAPTAGNLANGELAINITDGKLFYKDNAAAVQVIGWKTVPATAGGTGQTSYAVGDLLYANTTTTLAKLADVATGNALISGGVGVAPSWGKIGLTTHISGVLPVANGGTNASTASITSFNNITGYSASGATGTTTTNLVFSTSPSITTPTLVGDVPLSTGNIVFSTADKGLADSTSAQQVFVNTTGTGFGAATPAGYKTSTQVSTSDAALSRHYRLKSGGGSAIATMCTETTTAITTAKRIAGLESASFVIVAGNDGAGNEFMDLVITNNSGTPTVITSKTTSGSPAARTYTISSFNLNLAMASGTYATNVMWFQLSNR